MAILNSTNTLEVKAMATSAQLRIRLVSSGFRMFLVDWKSVLALWSRDWQDNPATAPNFQHIYSELWFQYDRRGERRFHVGELCYMSEKEPVSFVNGRHRTGVLSQFMTTVPISANCDLYRRKAFAPCIIRQIRKDEYLQVPDLPVWSPAILAKFRTDG